MRSAKNALLPAVALVLAGACVQLGSNQGGGTQGGVPVPLPVPPPPGGAACLDDEPSCSDDPGVAAFTACALDKCATYYEACYGAQFVSGVYDGDCKAYAECTARCTSCSPGCLSACAAAQSKECTVCLAQKVRTCVEVEVGTAACTAPCSKLSDAGTSLTDGGGTVRVDGGLTSGNCTALTLCCIQLQPEDATTCQTAITEANGDDAQCANVLAVYQGAGKCP